MLIGWLYLITCISHALFRIELRVEYGTLKIFSGKHFNQFLLYMLPIFIFILFINGIFLFGQAPLPGYGSEGKTQLVWWLKDVKAAPGGAAFLFKQFHN